jgi:hypothetical protein
MKNPKRHFELLKKLSFAKKGDNNLSPDEMSELQKYN